MTKKQKEELAKYCLDISKLLIGSWVLGVFTIVGPLKIFIAFAGLTFSVMFIILGMRLLRGIP